MSIRPPLWILPALLLCACSTPGIQGAWHPEQYTLQNGITHEVDGLIVFTESDWNVLFFVTENGEPRRASAEGGSFFFRGNRLILTHDYNFAYGDEVRGLAATAPSFRILGAAAATEMCTVEMTEDAMTLFFPSGNTMTFRRSSGF
jgi:hypothetical protein